jgi:SAM-dependent methyltransferase
MALYDSYSHRSVTTIGKKLNERLFATVFDIASENCTPGARIVEIGVGAGSVAKRFIKNGYDYSGYEPTVSLYEQLKRQNVPVKNEFIPPLSEDDRTVDCVVMTHVMEHLTSYKEAVAACSEINRVLKPGGRLVVLAPDYTDFGMLFFDADYTHSFITTPNRIRQLITDTGFSIERRVYFYGALPPLPGALCNFAIKTLFFVFAPLSRLLTEKWYSAFKVRYLFARSFLFVASRAD